MEESLKLHRMRSLESIKYIGDGRGNTVHDKTCKLLDELDDANFTGFDHYPDSYNQCRKCAVKSYVRIGAKDLKKFPEYKKLLHLMGADNELVKDMYLKHGFITTMAHMQTGGSPYARLQDNAIAIKYKEDTWRIGIIEIGKVRLEHNNYRLHSDGTREFTSGFHVQSDLTYSMPFNKAVEYILGYEFADHSAAVLNSESSREGKSCIINRVIDFFGKDRIRALRQLDEGNMPSGLTICLYEWKDSKGELHWATGSYVKKRGVFRGSFGAVVIETPAAQIIRYVPLNEINI